jgi:hypothetical protein
MRTEIRRLIRASLLFLIVISGGYMVGQGRIAYGAEANVQAACLKCHGGSFDTLASRKPAFKAHNGEMVNPHQYVPHNEKKSENVPDCMNCHTRHPIPPREKIDLSKINLDSCYLSCHHEQNFQPCGKCHQH